MRSCPCRLHSELHQAQVDSGSCCGSKQAPSQATMSDPNQLYWLKKDLKRLRAKSQPETKEQAEARTHRAQTLLQPSLWLDAETNDLEDCRRLLETGANVNEHRGKADQTPLHIAAENGHFEIASQLLAHGAEVDATDAQGSTPLLLAAKWANNNYINLVQLLLLAGANPNCTDTFGKSPLFFAARRQDAGLVQLLAEADADGWLPTAAALRMDEVVARGLSLAAAGAKSIPMVPAEQLRRAHDRIRALEQRLADCEKKPTPGGTGDR